MDEGWTRWVLEQYGFEYRHAPSRRTSSAPLRQKVDVAHPRRRCADAGGEAAAAGAAAAAAAAAAACARSTRISVSADDLAAFEQFVRGGGTLVCLSNASTFAIQQFKLPVQNVVAGLRPEEFFLRGSIVEVTTDPRTR